MHVNTGSGSDCHRPCSVCRTQTPHRTCYVLFLTAGSFFNWFALKHPFSGPSSVGGHHALLQLSAFLRNGTTIGPAAFTSDSPSLSTSEPAVLKDRHLSLARARQMSKSSGRRASGQSDVHVCPRKHKGHTTATSSEYLNSNYSPHTC